MKAVFSSETLLATYITKEGQSSHSEERVSIRQQRIHWSPLELKISGAEKEASPTPRGGRALWTAPLITVTSTQPRGTIAPEVAHLPQIEV
jgi:hypothetical protein